MKVSSLKNRVRKITMMCNGLIDEIFNESNCCTKLQEKVDECEVVIDLMQREFAGKEGKYESVIAYMNSY